LAGFYRESGAKARHKGRTWGVYATPEKRQRGIGRKLLQLFLERAGAIDGLEQIHLSVTTTRAAAAQLYRSMEREPFGVEPRTPKIGGRCIDEEYMLLRLKYEDEAVPISSPKRKAPWSSYGPGRLGSPPPELPNQENLCAAAPYGWLS
jgi:Acetyltransferase (GNAT) family